MVKINEEEQIIDIDENEFEKVFTDDIRTVIRIIRKYGFDIRVVGGAVRDFLRGIVPRDIDFATDADPNELIYILQKEGIEFISDGIEHGTIKAKFGNDKIDITSISYKLNNSNNKITIKKFMSWEEDAFSRDLTINSMSMNLNGKIYDYTNGIFDLKHQIIRMLPDTKKLLRNNPHLILRWFKAIGYFENPKWPKEDFKVIKTNIDCVQSIKDDKKTSKELNAIKSGINGERIIRLMKRLGVFNYINI